MHWLTTGCGAARSGGAEASDADGRLCSTSSVIRRVKSAKKHPYKTVTLRACTAGETGSGVSEHTSLGLDLSITPPAVRVKGACRDSQTAQVWSGTASR